MPGCSNCKRHFSSVKAWEYHECSIADTPAYKKGYKMALREQYDRECRSDERNFAKDHSFEEWLQQ